MLCKAQFFVARVKFAREYSGTVTIENVTFRFHLRYRLPLFLISGLLPFLPYSWLTELKIFKSEEEIELTALECSAFLFWVEPLSYELYQREKCEKRSMKQNGHTYDDKLPYIHLGNDEYVVMHSDTYRWIRGPKFGVDFGPDAIG